MLNNYQKRMEFKVMKGLVSLKSDNDKMDKMFQNLDAFYHDFYFFGSFSPDICDF